MNEKDHYVYMLISYGLELPHCLSSDHSELPLAPVAETGFSHRFTAYKIVEHFFGLSYRKISGRNQVKNFFFRISNISVPCSHAQLGGRTVIKNVRTFFRPWGRDRSQLPPCWIFRVKQIHPSTASERTTRQSYLQPFFAVINHWSTVAITAAGSL